MPQVMPTARRHTACVKANDFPYIYGTTKFSMFILYVDRIISLFPRLTEGPPVRYQISKMTMNWAGNRASFIVSQFLLLMIPPFLL